MTHIYIIDCLNYVEHIMKYNYYYYYLFIYWVSLYDEQRSYAGLATKNIYNYYGS